MGDGSRHRPSAVGAGELSAGGSDGRGHGASRHLHTEPFHPHTHQDHAQETQLPGTCKHLLQFLSGFLAFT